jgi:hypothetical protein
MTVQRLDVCSVRPYTDKNTGEAKTAFKRVGACFRYDDGQETIVLDSVPVPQPNPKNPAENVLVLKVFHPRDDQQGGERNNQSAQGQGGQQGQGRQQQAPAQQAPAQSGAFNDDIPF